MPLSTGIFLVCMIVLVSVIAFSFLRYQFTKSDSCYMPSRYLGLLKKHRQPKSGASFLDLGCGDGWALRFFARHFAPSQCVGYEYARAPYYMAKLFCSPFKKITIHKKDFTKEVIDNYDYVYTFLLPNQLEDIESWLFSAIGKNTTVISLLFPYPNKKPYKTIKNTQGKIIFRFYKN